MKKAKVKEKKITRIPAWIQATGAILLPPVGAILIMIDKNGEKKEKAKRDEEDRNIEEIINSSKKKDENGETETSDNNEANEES